MDRYETRTPQGRTRLREFSRHATDLLVTDERRRRRFESCVLIPWANDVDVNLNVYTVRSKARQQAAVEALDSRLWSRRAVELW